MAIRVADEVPNYSAWTIRPVSTLDGAWSIANRISASPNTLVNANQINLAFDGGGTAMYAWGLRNLVVSNGGGTSCCTNGDVVLVSSTDREVVPMAADYPGAIRYTVRMASRPTTGFGVAVSGSGPVNYVDDPGPGQAATKSLIVSTGLDVDQTSHVAFVGDHATGWNPVVDYVRLDSKTKQSKRATLMVAERVNGNWAPVPVLTYEATTGTNIGFFLSRETFAGADGNPRFVVPHCGVFVYAERDASGVWHYYDAGPAPAPEGRSLSICRLRSLGSGRSAAAAPVWSSVASESPTSVRGLTRSF